MKRHLALLLVGGSAALGLAGAAAAGPIAIDGSLDAAYGAPLAVQTQISNVPLEIQSNPANPGSTRASFQTLSQLSAAYGYIDTTNHQLDLFIAGSQNLGANTKDTSLVLVLQTNALGVQSLAGQTELPAPSGSTTPPLDNIVFDPGFAPQALFTFQYNGGIASDYYNLTTQTHVAADLDPASGSTASQSTFGADSFNSAHTYGYDQPGAGGTGNPTNDFAGERTRTDPGAPTYSIAVNNTLEQVRIGSGSAAQSTSHGDIPADPGFTGATTGAEYQFDLSSDPTDTSALYYTGGPINVSAFLVISGFSATTNQVLGTASGTPAADVYAGGGSGNGGTDAESAPQYFDGTQFLDGTYYSGNQFFTVPAPAPVPEPASLSLIAAGAMLLGCRRTR